jgi:Flp pilus assembly protein TadD
MSDWRNPADLRRKKVVAERTRIQPTAQASIVRRWPLWISIGLIALNIAIYAPVAHHDFVNFDDDDYVTNNDVVGRGLTWNGISWALTTAHASNWHPLTWISHMLDVQLYGMNAGGHHVTSLLLHIASSILLFALLYRMTGAVWRSAFVAALFAVHPLHVESVAWVAERKDVLSTLFAMLTIWSYVVYVQRPSARRYLSVLVLFALGLMAKPMLVTLPFALLLLDFWPLQRATISNLAWALRPAAGAGANGKQESRDLLWRLAREKLPLLALTVLSSVVTYQAQLRGNAVVGLAATALDRRIENALIAYVAYIGKTIWPAHLAVLYPYSQQPLTAALGAALVLIAASIVAIRLARRCPYLPVGWFWFLGTLVPVIGIVQVGSQSMADRYTYVPLIGLFLIAAWGGADLLGRLNRQASVLVMTAGITIAACTVAARIQVGYWENGIALWQHAVNVTRDNFMAHGNLGNVLSRAGRVDEAITNFNEALRLRPDYTDSHTNLGIALAKQGRLAEALPHFSTAASLSPAGAEKYNNLGSAYANLGRIDESIAEYEKALRLKPDYPEAHHNLGLALSKKGQADDAVAHYREALRLKPDYPDAHSNLGAALANQGKIDDAIREFTEALRIDPANSLAKRLMNEIKSPR